METGKQGKYQQGSIRKVKRANGNHVWEWRFRKNGKMKQEKFLVVDYPTKSDLRKHLQTAVKNLNAGADKPVPQAPTMDVQGRLSARPCEEHTQH